MVKDEEIKEIALNPRFCANDDLGSLINQGFSVRWMTEEECNEKNIFTLETTESK